MPRIRTITLDEVKITRDGGYAVFRYKGPSMGGGMRPANARACFI